MKTLNLKKLSTMVVFAGLFALQACNVSVTTPVYTASLADSAQTFNVGKTSFDVVVEDQNGTATSGLTVTVDPQMDMTTLIHNTPVESVTDNGDGTYTVIAYFLMSGDTWTLNFNVDGEDLVDTISIVVGGSMMDRGVLKGSIADMIMPETGGIATNRSYIIFKSSVDFVNGNVDLFLAARDNLLSHPAVYAGQTLNDDLGLSWTVGTVNLKICSAGILNDNGTVADTTDDYYDCTAWTTLTDNGNGHFTATGLGDISFDTTNMMAGNQFSVRLYESTTAEDKTTDGTVPGTMMTLTSKINQ